MTTPTATLFVPYHALDAAVDAGIGQWTDVPFAAADYTAVGGSWTVEFGDVSLFAYTVIGQTAIVTLQLNQSTVVSGGPTALTVTLPAGLTVARMGIGMAAMFVSGWQIGHAIALGTQLFIQRADISAFPALADFGCYLTVTFAVV